MLTRAPPPEEVGRLTVISAISATMTYPRRYFRPQSRMLNWKRSNV